MGAISSRAVLCEPSESRKGEVYYRRNFSSVPQVDRLVCNELRKEIQRCLSESSAKTRYRIPVIQVSPQSLQ